MIIGCEDAAFPKLTELRSTRGWSKRTLAERLRVAGYPARPALIEALLRRVEAHGQRPSAALVLCLARATGLNVDATLELFDGQADRPTP